MLSKIKELYSKHKEILLYLIFGVGTTAVDFAVSYILYPTRLNIHIVHVIAWICAVTFAFVTNKIFVFESRTTSVSAISKEMISFASSRVLTLILQEIIVFGLHDKLGLSEYIVKIPATVLVVILNYILSKLFVFRRKK